LCSSAEAEGRTVPRGLDPRRWRRSVAVVRILCGSSSLRGGTRTRADPVRYRGFLSKPSCASRWWPEHNAVRFLIVCAPPFDRKIHVMQVEVPARRAARHRAAEPVAIITRRRVGAGISGASRCISSHSRSPASAMSHSRRSRLASPSGVSRRRPPVRSACRPCTWSRQQGGRGRASPVTSHARSPVRPRCPSCADLARRPVRCASPATARRSHHRRRS